jgi:enoyl-CoA hydratase/carnithine racemase
MNDRVTVTIEGGVADVRLTRADKMNAIDDAMFDALIQTGERLKTEAGVRAVVLCGEGRAFCAGLRVSCGRRAKRRARHRKRDQRTYAGRCPSRPTGRDGLA